MAANNTMYLLNERAQFAYDNPHAAVSEKSEGLVLYECAFRIHGIPMFCTTGIPRQVFPDTEAIKAHFRTIIFKDVSLAELERLTEKACEVYGDAGVTVRKRDDRFVINHHEPVKPDHVFRSRQFERRVRDVMVARHTVRYPTPRSFASLAEICAYLDDRQDKMAQAARLAETLSTATVRAQAVLSDPVARVIQGRRATDNGQYLLFLGREINGLKTYAFTSLELLDAFIKRHPRESFPRRAVPHRSSDGFQPAVSLSV